MATETAVQETWRSFTRGVIGVCRLDHRGEMTGYEMVAAGRRLHITSLERRLNQEKTVSEDLDPFLNGMLIPERLDPNDPDTKKLLANPNIVSDDDLAKLVKGAARALMERLEQITNLLTLERIYAAAIEADVTVRRAEAIKARITALRTSVAQQRRAVAEARVAAEDADGPPRRRRLRQPTANVG